MPTVLELFTSQGCSSCPSADALLKSYAQRPGVIALSLSVDYWDHLGWKDTLASPKNTARQKAYAKALGTGNVYTPQIVINGVAETIGSNKSEIEKAICAGPQWRQNPAWPHRHERRQAGDDRTHASRYTARSVCRHGLAGGRGAAR